MRLADLVRNRLSYAGGAIGTPAFVVLVFLFMFHAVTEASRAPSGWLIIFIAVANRHDPAIVGVFGAGALLLGRQSGDGT